MENTDKEEKSLKENFNLFTQSTYKFIKKTLSFSEDVDSDFTIQSIKRDIDFRGLNVWILFFSILIASLGLNVDSIAVIIGAMLISPLMGPIMGIGLSVGINDYVTLVRSLKSLTIAVTVSLFASTLYFIVTPFDEASHQLLSRTQPMLFDVFIATFGGLAGIMAASTSKNKISNVIPGVAIATALMPPLCTAGYGIAHLNWDYFSGAFYLFLINGVYISLSTFVVVRYLKFPVVHLIDKVKDKKLTRYITIFAILLIIPSVITLYSSYKYNRFNAGVKQLIAENFDSDFTDVVVDYKRDSVSVVYIQTKKNISKISEEDLNNQLASFKLKDTRIILTDEDEKFIKLENELKKLKLGDLPVNSNALLREYKNALEKIKAQETEILFLNHQMNQMFLDSAEFVNIVNEVKINYPMVNKFSIGRVTQKNTKTIEVVPTLLVRWTDLPSAEDKNKLKDWLKIRLKLNDLQVINY